MKNRPADFILPRIRSLSGYVPGLQPADPEVIKLNTNENPFPVSRRVREALLEEIQSDRLHLYPEARADRLRQAIGEKYGRDGSVVLVGNGSDEVLSIIFRSLLGVGDRVVFHDPGYSLYPVLADLLGAIGVPIDVDDEWRVDLDALLQAARGEGGESGEIAKANSTVAGRTPLSIITNPNAPTGMALSAQNILDFARDNPGLTLVDEAYVEFGAESVAHLAGTEEYPRLLCCNTFSKAYSLAGQRVGWLIAHPDLIREMDKVRDSYNLSRLAQTAALAALQDEEEMKRRSVIVCENREALTAELGILGFQILPSSANFIYAAPPHGDPHRAGAEIGSGEAARRYYEALQERKILIRYFDRPRLNGFVRITVGTVEQMEKLVRVTAEILPLLL